LPAKLTTISCPNCDIECILIYKIWSLLHHLPWIQSLHSLWIPRALWLQYSAIASCAW
jgi:hypothetical protein